MKSLQASFSDSYSPNTRKAYGRAVECFATFLKGRAADDDSVAAFLKAEAKRGLAPASLSILVAAGASTAELMQAGRWTDAATATRYAANELAGRGAVARYFEDEDG